MKLFLCAQDLSFFWIGLLQEDGSFLVVEKKDVAPEQYLFVLDSFLREHAIASGHLQGVVVVTGPGSFTASRVSLTIANTLHFTQQLPLFTIENSEHLLPEALIQTKGIGTPLPSNEYAQPFYDRPANITKTIKKSGSLAA